MNGERPLKHYMDLLDNNISNNYDTYRRINNDKNKFDFVSHVLLPTAGLIPGVAAVPEVRRAMQNWFGGPRV